MCPHVKRVLDRAMAEDLPHLDGVVLVNSCDAMRRLADAWQRVRPEDPRFLLDLPPTVDAQSTRWLVTEMERLRRSLADWVGRDITDDDLDASIARSDELAGLIGTLRGRLREGTLPGGCAAMQSLYNEISACSFAEGIDAAKRLLAQPPSQTKGAGVPVHLFGNVLPDPAVFELIEACGARVVSDDLCTGSRLVRPIRGDGPAGAPIEDLASALLSRQPCARTFRTAAPGGIGASVVEQARAGGASAVLAYVMKFCDPYLVRMPGVQEACTAASLPLLILEGDCTLRSLGQQSTRIEAFVEMMEVRT